MVDAAPLLLYAYSQIGDKARTMSSRKQSTKDPRERISAIKQQILEIDLIVAGTLNRRTKVCGKAACRCATDPEARHGPYFEWGRIQGKRRVSTTVSPKKARMLKAALTNQRRIKALLRRWERESVRLIDAEIAASHD